MKKTLLATATLLAATMHSLPAATRDAGTNDGRAVPAQKESPFACDMQALTPQIRKRHFDELAPQLRMMIKAARELPTGYEFEFPSDAASYMLVAEFVAWESACCPFFDLTLR